MNSKINLSLGSVAIAAKKLAGHHVERRTVAHAKNIMNIMLVHEHNLVPTTMNKMKTFVILVVQYIVNYAASLSFQGATQNHKIVFMTK